MRTTVTLDPDTEALIRRTMAERGVSFKRALNDLIRGGGVRRDVVFVTPAHDLGLPMIHLDKALQIAGELEDDELIRKMQAGK